MRNGRLGCRPGEGSRHGCAGSGRGRRREGCRRLSGHHGVDPPVRAQDLLRRGVRGDGCGGDGVGGSSDGERPGPREPPPHRSCPYEERENEGEQGGHVLAQRTTLHDTEHDPADHLGGDEAGVEEARAPEADGHERPYPQQENDGEADVHSRGIGRELPPTTVARVRRVSHEAVQGVDEEHDGVQGEDDDGALRELKRRRSRLLPRWRRQGEDERDEERDGDEDDAHQDPRHDVPVGEDHWSDGEQ